MPGVLRQVPGLAVNQAGGPGAVTQVRTRGSEGNHTLVLLDGIDVSSPDQGETDFSTLDRLGPWRATRFLEADAPPEYAADVVAAVNGFVRALRA